MILGPGHLFWNMESNAHSYCQQFYNVCQRPGIFHDDGRTILTYAVTFNSWLMLSIVCRSTPLSLSLSLSLSFVQVVRISMYPWSSVFNVIKDRIPRLAMIWMKNLEWSENSQTKLVLNYAICEFCVSVPYSR